MSEKMTDGMTEAQRRAEKIKAIRRSIRGEAEVAPTTYENKAEAERADVNVGRLRRTEDRSGSTAADILYELDKAIANEKAEAERIAAREAEAAAAAAAKAGPDISDIIPALEPNAQEKLHEIAEEITEDFSEVRANVTGDVMDFTETETADTAYSEPEQEHTYYNEPRAHETAADIIRADAAEDTVVFTPVGHHHEEAPPPAAEKWAEPVMRAAAEGMTTEKSHKKKKKKKKTFTQKLRGLFPEKGDSVLECVRKIVFLGSVIAIFVCGYLVGDYYYELWASKHKTENIMEIYDIYDDREAATVAVEEEGETRIRFEGMLDGARKLWDQNHDIVGVINIPDTPINNPVMQADDNKKYMNMKFDLSENRAGEIFLDYRNHFDEVGEDGYLKCPNSGNLVIYGHNMLDEQMFGSLKWYQRHEDYYGKHPIIYLSSNYRKYTYKIFAYFILDSGDETDTKFDCWNELEFSDEDEFYGFVNEAKRRTLRLNDVDVKYGDPLITLSTCNTTLPDEDAGRLIIMARMVRDGEDPMAGTQNSKPNPNIKWPTSYYQDHPNERYDPNAEFVPYG